MSAFWRFVGFWHWMPKLNHEVISRGPMRLETAHVLSHSRIILQPDL